MRIGIIGAGQLGRMLALAGYPLGHRFTFLDSSDDAPGAQVGSIVLGAFEDPARVAALAAEVELLTFDFENVPVDAVREVAARMPFHPPVAALAVAQDRVDEKDCFRAHGIPTPDYRAVGSMLDLEAAAQALGLPAVLKTRRLGYDGKGQRMVRSALELGGAFESLSGVPLILEAFVPFEREVSIVAVRSTRGEFACYPLTENQHTEGILRTSVAPFVDATLQAEAEAHARRLMEAFDYAGVLAIEFFVVAGRLVANEMAPRVHNSGHWTIEGAVTSQFENHLRAITGMPLGDTAARGHSAMLNLIGSMPDAAAVLAIPGAHLHDYGKAPRPGRKLGHCTVTGADRATVEASLGRLRLLLGGGAAV